MKNSIICTALTDRGLRYENNEDFYALPQPSKRYAITDEDIENEGKLYILCDGMGGAKSGEVASELTAGWVARGFYSREGNGREPLKALKAVIVDVNTKIHDLAAEHEQYHGMCTTLVAAHIQGDTFSVCSVGDSRAYLLRENNLTQLTEDHSQVWQLFRSGAITKEELRKHPRNHVLNRAIGAVGELDVDKICHCRETIRPNDLFLLCSDGLSDMVAEDEIENILSKDGPLDKMAAKLIEKANENGGKDNITVVLISDRGTKG